MDREDFASRELPRRRTGRRLRWVSDASVWRIASLGIAAYVGLVLVFSIIEFLIHQFGGQAVVHQVDKQIVSANIWEILYFNFVTILTIGYGDFFPVGFGRVLAVAEGMLGVGIIGVVIAALTAKFLSAPRESIVFSRFGYYCTDEQRFLLIFVNTTNNRMVNAEMASYFKLGGDWSVREAIRSPFITQSVQTFFMDKVPITELVERLRDGDVFRFSIVGRLGDAAFSTAIQYSPEEIIVLPNREILVAYSGFSPVDFNSPGLVEMFNYRPENAPTLVDFVEQSRSGLSE